MSALTRAPSFWGMLAAFCSATDADELSAFEDMLGTFDGRGLEKFIARLDLAIETLTSVTFTDAAGLVLCADARRCAEVRLLSRGRRAVLSASASREPISIGVRGSESAIWDLVEERRDLLATAFEGLWDRDSGIVKIALQDHQSVEARALDVARGIYGAAYRVENSAALSAWFDTPNPAWLLIYLWPDGEPGARRFKARRSGAGIYVQVIFDPIGLPGGVTEAAGESLVRDALAIAVERFGVPQPPF